MSQTRWRKSKQRTSQLLTRTVPFEEEPMKSKHSGRPPINRPTRREPAPPRTNIFAFTGTQPFSPEYSSAKVVGKIPTACLDLDTQTYMSAEAGAGRS